MISKRRYLTYFILLLDGESLKKRYSVSLTEVNELFPPTNPAEWMDLDATLLRAFDTSLFSFARWQQVYYIILYGMCLRIEDPDNICALPSIEGFGHPLALLDRLEDFPRSLGELQISELLYCQERILCQLEIM